MSSVSRYLEATPPIGGQEEKKKVVHGQGTVTVVVVGAVIALEIGQAKWYSRIIHQ